jgi:hypothetical protein
MRNAILISEYLFLIWVKKRRQLVFDRKPFKENEVRVCWEGKLKWRVKADAKRWDNDKFVKVWGRQKLI